MPATRRQAEGMIPSRLVTDRSAFEAVPYPCTIHLPEISAASTGLEPATDLRCSGRLPLTDSPSAAEGGLDPQPACHRPHRFPSEPGPLSGSSASGGNERTAYPTCRVPGTWRSPPALRPATYTRRCPARDALLWGRSVQAPRPCARRAFYQ